MIEGVTNHSNQSCGVEFMHITWVLEVFMFLGLHSCWLAPWQLGELGLVATQDRATIKLRGERDDS